MRTPDQRSTRSLLGGGVLLGLGALVAWPLLPAPVGPQAAYGGIVIMQNGNTYVGRIRDDEIQPGEHLIVRWPYKENTDFGEVKINFTPENMNPRQEDIRWYDPEADEPTEEYFEQFHMPLDGVHAQVRRTYYDEDGKRTDAYWEAFRAVDLNQRWHGVRDRWILDQRRDDGLGDGGLDWLDGIENPDDYRPRLAPLPVVRQEFKVRKPEGWTAELEGTITIIRPDDRSGWAQNYVPRIHVFSMPSPPDLTNDRVSRDILANLTSLAGPNSLDIKKRGGLEQAPNGGRDQELLTVSTVENRTVYALRLMAFRDERIYFFTAYAHADDYDRLQWLFRLCRESLEIHEDQAVEGEGEDAEDAPADGAESPGEGN